LIARDLLVTEADNHSVTLAIRRTMSLAAEQIGDFQTERHTIGGLVAVRDFQAS
jgi:hypothetical protein